MFNGLRSLRTRLPHTSEISHKKSEPAARRGRTEGGSSTFDSHFVPMRWLHAPCTSLVPAAFAAFAGRSAAGLSVLRNHGSRAGDRREGGLGGPSGVYGRRATAV